MLLDKEAIREASDVFIIAEELGLDVKYKGNKALILCPFHDDKHFGSCFLTNHGFKCYSCGKSGDIFTLVQGVLDVSFQAALQFVANVCGGTEHFIAGDENCHTYENYISHADQVLIGIMDAPIYTITDFAFQKDELDSTSAVVEAIYDQYDSLVGYVAKKRVTVSPLRDLFQHDLPAYKALIDQFCTQSIGKYRNLLQLFTNESISDPILEKVINVIRINCGDELIMTYLTDLINRIQRISIMHGNGIAIRSANEKNLLSESRPLGTDKIAAIQNSIWEKEGVPF